MRKLSLLTAVLLLSCAWAVAQTSPSSDSSQNPSSTQPSTQSPSSTSPSTTSPTSQQPDTSATTSKGGEEKGNAIEGCLSGSSGNYTLTDASGTTYQLAGDTSKLSDHVGHQVKVWGETASSGASSSASSSGASASASSPQTLNVKRVKMVSSSCSNK